MSVICHTIIEYFIDKEKIRLHFLIDTIMRNYVYTYMRIDFLY